MINSANFSYLWRQLGQPVVEENILSINKAKHKISGH